MPVAPTPEQLIDVPARGLPRLRLRGGGLMKAAAAGDPAAFEEIYRRHHQEIYRYCLGILRNGADAEDALQATMAAALRALPGEGREIALRAWLFRVAHNESVSLLRSRRGDVAEEDAVLTSPQSTAERVEEREAMGALLADLAELPERQRGALLMRELSGLSFAEIGVALGCSDLAARQTLFTARVALKEADEGRAMSCEEIQAVLSDGDRRKLRGRKLKSHIAGCERCQDFKTAIDVRKDRLQVLCPPLAAVAASSLLAGLVGGGSGATAAATAGGAGVGAGAGAAGVGAGAGVAGASSATTAAAGALGAGAIVKGASVAAAVVIAAGAADVAGVIDAPGPLDISNTAQTSDPLEGGGTSTVPTNSAANKPGSARAQEARAKGVEASGAKGANGKANGKGGSGGRGKGKGKGGSNKGGKGQSQAGQGQTGGGKPSETPGGGNPGGNGTPAAPPANAGAGAGGGSGNAGGGSGSSPGSQAPTSGGSGGANGHAGGGPGGGGPPEHAAGNGPKS